MIAEALRQYNEGVGPTRQIRHTLVHTGQHYDPSMSDSFFLELAIPLPEHNLEVGSGSHGKQTAAMLERTEEILLRDRPDAIVVYGDTNSTVAGALAAVKLGIVVAHVEAGLRSFNRQMPEEINRVVTDHISNVLLCPTKTAAENLCKEGIVDGVFVTGDVMLDAVLKWREVAKDRSSILSRLALERSAYLLLTIHRAENTHSPERIAEVLESVLEIPYPIVFPMHPRTRACIDGDLSLRNLRSRLLASHTLKLIGPVSYLDMLALEDNAQVILTDSGGVQKEAYFLGVPCLTVRGETEWVETLDGGWNRLVQPTVEGMRTAIQSLWGDCAARPSESTDLSSFGRGKAAANIVRVLIEQVAKAGERA
jgi:UDP-N-acetylglucosamine 2-epimerase